MTRLLLENGADVNIGTADGISPLLWASRQGDLEGLTAIRVFAANLSVTGVRLLLEHKVDPNTQNRWVRHYPILISCSRAQAETALLWACVGGYFDIARLLINAGANVNAKSSKVPPGDVCRASVDYSGRESVAVGISWESCRPRHVSVGFWCRC